MRSTHAPHGAEVSAARTAILAAVRVAVVEEVLGGGHSHGPYVGSQECDALMLILLAHVLIVNVLAGNFSRFRVWAPGFTVWALGFRAGVLGFTVTPSLSI